MSNFRIINEHPTIFRAVRVEFLFSRSFRKHVRKACLILIAFCLLIWGGLYLYHVLEGGALVSAHIIIIFLALLTGLLWFMLFLEFYFLSVSRPEKFLNIEPEGKIFRLDFGGARRLYYLRALKEDRINISRLYRFLFTSNFVGILLMRMGMAREDFENFLRSQENTEFFVSRQDFFDMLIKEADETGSDIFGAREFTMMLFDLDKNFSKFLFDLHIKRQELSGAAGWAARTMEALRKNERWWLKTSLGRVPGIWSNLGFGRTFILDRYSHIITGDRSSFGGKIKFIAHQKELFQIEEILSRTSQSNVLLIGERGSGRHSVLAALASFITRGVAMPSLEHKQLISLDAVSLIAALNNKAALEAGMIKLMNETVSAGNVVLVIDNFPEFLESARLVGVDIMLLLESYLQSSSFQVIGLSDMTQFQHQLMRDGRVMGLFEKVEIKEPNKDDVILILEDIVPVLEYRNGVLVPYQAVEKIVELADLYIFDGVMPEKAIDLLDRCTSSAASAKIYVLTPEYVEQILSASTNTPTSKVSEDEANKLLHLEEELHKRVIGQEEAIRAISDSMRRVRSGLHGTKRPIGSFLFLGPTGVGKTETAKALAEVYFGSSEHMTRFDMSEYQGFDGIAKLMGSFERNEPGILTLALKERPFGLLLFDEFEKASKEVHNLFLQILDEGFFTDAFGKKAHLRQSIIIATSNAGSSAIWEFLQQGLDPNTLKNQVIDQIRKEGIFSPEILNRFDAMVIYHPLDKEQLRNVARLMLEDVVRQLREKEISFTITDELVSRVVEMGYDPLMGARPMRRTIQDKVEQLIAKKLLAGSLERGGAIEFTSEEIAAL